jgi:hypothetical protein
VVRAIQRALFGASNCGLATLQQCQATYRGVGGWYEPNPRYAGDQGRTRRHHTALYGRE